MSFKYILRNSFALTVIFTIVNIKSVESDYGERIELIVPVLAPPTNSRARVSETAKDYPILLLLANDDKNKREQPKKDVEPQPIYVQVRKGIINHSYFIYLN